MVTTAIEIVEIIFDLLAKDVHVHSVEHSIHFPHLGRKKPSEKK
jgi:hypothetical protein